MLTVAILLMLATRATVYILVRAADNVLLLTSAADEAAHGYIIPASYASWSRKLEAILTRQLFLFPTGKDVPVEVRGDSISERQWSGNAPSPRNVAVAAAAATSSTTTTTPPPPLRHQHETVP